MTLDHWLAAGAQELADLARLADGTEVTLDEFLERGLEWLGRLAPYDLAVVFELRGDELRARAASGPLSRPEVREHRLRLEDFPSIRLAIKERRSRVFTEEACVLGESVNGRVRELGRQSVLVASTGSTVLLVGETGTGKERLARFIHERSRRRQGPFVPVNCAALPAGTLESELFGHERGAFTGAVRARPGLFRAADGGTLFLDEIGELPVDLQGKLLRALQEGEIQPVGSEHRVKVNVRVIAATHQDLERDAAAGRFREDLYYRLSVFPLRLVPLRERLEDLPQLCAALLRELAPRVGRPVPALSDAALEALGHLDYPGNIRELSNLLERGAIRAASGVIERSDLGLSNPRPRRRSGGRASEDELVSLAEHERRYIERVLTTTGGRIYGEGGAAMILGVPPTTLQSRMKRLGIQRSAGT